jgi:nucleotide-binding universal stress UspA family protein
MTDTAVDRAMSIVVLLDAPSLAGGAPWRAAWIARHMNASLLLLRVGRAAERSALGEDPLQRLAGQVGARFGIAVSTKDIEQGRTDELLANVRSATLLVIASRRGNTLRERIAGMETERIIRLCNTLVLVVKRPCNGPPDRHAPVRDCGYQRVLAAVRLESEVSRIADIACALAPNVHVELFHALPIKGPRSSPAVANDSARPTTPAAQAASRLGALIGSPALQARCLTSCGWGAAGDAVIAKERALGAELLVLGKRRRGLLADFFLGGVTQHVLSTSRADVLVVPQLQSNPAAERFTAQLESAG